jgi:flagellar basal-body rod modification protein FlgD
VLSSTQPNSPNQTTTNKLALKPEDFIKMMITELQQQDPTEPAKNDQLLAQMSQIGQLQASTDLQDSLKGLVLQNQISSSATLIGKTVQGMDANNNTIGGLVSSVRVQSDGVSLELDNGQSLVLSRVTSITPGPTAAGGGTTAANGA